MPRGSVPEWGAYAEQASDGGQPAEPIVAADRFAREIVRFLTCFGSALAALMGRPFGGCGSVVGTPLVVSIGRDS